MTVIGNYSLSVNKLPENNVCLADKTRVVIQEPVVLKRADNLSVKSNFGTVPAKENIGFEKKESHHSSATKVVAELVSSGLNLLVKHEPQAVVESAKGVRTIGNVAAKTMPAVVTGINVGITLYDSHDSYLKLTDKNVSLPSKALSVTTVGLDLVTVFAHHAGYGKTAALASVVSIGTSLASEYYRDDSKTSK